MTFDLVKLILRVIHIPSGVFWVGSTFFLAGFLGKAVQATGPEGGKVMQTLLTRTRFITAVATSSTLTALTGVLMYYTASGGFQWAWVRTTAGMILTIGALLGLVGFFHGLFAVGRANLRIAAIARQSIASAQAPSPDEMAELQRLQAKVARNGTILATILLLAVIGMAAPEAF